MHAVDAFRDTLTSRADPRMAALCRIVVGAAAVLELATTGPMMVRFFAEAEFVPAPNFEWLPAPTPGGAVALVVIGVLASIGFSVGFLTRFSGIVLAGTVGYRLVLDQNLYSNHAYLLVLAAFLLVLADAGSAFSLDSRLGWKQVSDIPNWPLALIRVQVSLVYLFTGLAKLNPVFLGGHVLEVHTRLAAIVGTGYGLVVAAWLIMLWEVFQAGALWFPKLRGVAFVGGLLFHGSIVLLMKPFPSAALIVFGMVSLACYLLFVDVRPATTGRNPYVPNRPFKTRTGQLSA